MSKLRYIFALIILSLIPAVCSAEAKSDKPVSTKKERNYIVEGNKLYKEKRFAEAEVLYRKALEVNPTSEVANYNLAASLIRQSGSTDKNNSNDPLASAEEILKKLVSSAKQASIVEKANYNLGNIYFNKEDYAKSIEFYKNALRVNPDNDITRENLRLAQLKKNDQKNDQNQDNQNQQNQDQEQNQNQQNQDQNKDDQKQDQNQDQNQQKQDNQDQKQQPQQQSSISDANAEKILKAMENAEAATRRRVDAQKQKEANSSRHTISNPW